MHVGAVRPGHQVRELLEAGARRCGHHYGKPERFKSTKPVREAVDGVVRPRQRSVTSRTGRLQRVRHVRLLGRAEFEEHSLAILKIATDAVETDYESRVDHIAAIL